MFVNYVRAATRRSPLNLTVARAVLGLYVVWKTVWYDWEAVVRFPLVLAGDPYTILLPPAPSLVLTLEKWALILVMLSFVVGYRLRTSSFLGTLLLGHLATVRFTLDPSGATTSLFIAVWFVLFFGLFHEQAGLAVDAVSREFGSLPGTNQFLKSGSEGFRMDALRFSLLSMALVYFGAGFLKVVQGPLVEWATVENLSRTIVMMNAKNDIPGNLGLHLVQYPAVVFTAAWGTILLELGLLAAVLLGLSITPFVLGFFVMQFVIGLAMGPFFFDIYPLFLLFVAWDDVLNIGSSDGRLTLVYDEHCLLCARSLALFKTLDADGSVEFYSQHDAPDRYRNRDAVDFASAMYVFRDGVCYRGYDAFRELIGHVGFPRVAWTMGLPPVA